MLLALILAGWAVAAVAVTYLLVGCVALADESRRRQDASRPAAPALEAVGAESTGDGAEETSGRAWGDRRSG